MSDSAATVAQTASAPAPERYDAQADVTKSIMNSLIPAAELQPVIDMINGAWEQQEFMKARNNVIPFPNGKQTKNGPVSVVLDEYQVGMQGDYWERPGILGFDAMRAMVDQTPILSAILLTRQRQISRFCRPQTDRSQPGFIIEPVDHDLELGAQEKKSIRLLENFMLNCGWEDDPRRRKRLKRDSFAQFMAKSVRDTLSLDACPIETVFKNDRSLGLDGFLAVDGGSIRLCTEEGYEGDDEIFAVQVIQGTVRAGYTYDNLVYEVRNPRTDVTANGYGFGEPEMLIKVVTYLLNTLTYNGSFFDKNSIPRGILNLVGDYSPEDLLVMKRYWNSMVSGAANVHNLPIMVSKDPGSKADFVEVGGQLSEMAFGKWMSLLTSLSCAIYGADPAEISMESFSADASSLSGSDTEQKLGSSKDKGLRPLLSFYENLFTDFIIRPFSPKYRLRYSGLGDDDAQQRFEARKLGQTWNEFRRDEGQDAIEGPIGDCPMNASLIPMWQAATGIGQPQPEQEPQEEPEDFGDPDQADGPTRGQDEPSDGSSPTGDPNAAPKPSPGAAPQPDFGSPMAKAYDFGLPPLFLEP